LAARIRQARPRLGPLGSTIRFFPTIGSTNDVAAALARSDDHCEGAVVIADEQTAGRGRRGHGWHSPPGSGLYVSVVVAPARAKTDPSRATMLLTLAVGVALAESVQGAVGLPVQLKWPNDVFVGRRKLAGILAEAAERDRRSPAANLIVVGYGLNVAATAYPPELRDRATSLERELGRRVDRDHLLVETLAALARRYDDLLEGRFDAILDAWRRLSPASIGSGVSWSTASGVQRGVTSGIDGDGALLVKVGERVERIVSGELTWS
jgi:BirA family biotin operon repressor/biotin-[acetyl-CoA-carboxylase] ligase